LGRSHSVSALIHISEEIDTQKYKIIENRQKCKNTSAADEDKLQSITAHPSFKNCERTRS
jgi:hypothetical protein